MKNTSPGCDGMVSGIDVIATPGQPIRCLAFVSKQPNIEVQVTARAHELQTALELACAKRVPVEVSYLEQDQEKTLTRVHLLDRPPAPLTQEETKQRQLKVSLSTDTTWYAACDTGHPFWSGPDESTYNEARHDADGHDKTHHMGVATAIVLNDRVRGGGAQITQLGMAGRVSLGASRVGVTVTFSIAGPATVQFDMFMLYATVPCGSWTFAGPGSFQQLLGGNILGCDPLVDDYCSLSAFAQNGTVPVWVTANP